MPDTRKLLGLFAPGNMDGVLDHKFLRAAASSEIPTSQI